MNELIALTQSALILITRKQLKMLNKLVYLPCFFFSFNSFFFPKFVNTMKLSLISKIKCACLLITYRVFSLYFLLIFALCLSAVNKQMVFIKIYANNNSTQEMNENKTTIELE